MPPHQRTSGVLQALGGALAVFVPCATAARLLGWYRGGSQPLGGVAWGASGRAPSHGVPLSRPRHWGVGARADARATLLGVMPQWLARLCKERYTDCACPLGRHCIHTHLGIWSIIRFFIAISAFLHWTDAGDLVLWWHTPCFLLPRLQCILCKVRRMVSCETDAIRSHATISSASRSHVQRSCPSGA